MLPAKGLVNEEGNPTTTYEIMYNKKARVQRFKVFGCPVVFKRYQPLHDGDVTTTFRQLQRGSRGTFVGFPKNQAGWLIYVPEKLSQSHLIVSSDVDFDQFFLSGVEGITKPFRQGQPERGIGGNRGRQPNIDESTGDITNLVDSSVTHWGCRKTYDSNHSINPYNALRQDSSDEEDDINISNNNDLNSSSSSQNNSDESDNDVDNLNNEISEENVINGGGSQHVDGL